MNYENKEELKVELNKAIEANDGYLTHWYGSHLQKLYELEAESKRMRTEYKERLDRIWIECQLRAEDKVRKYQLGIK